MPNNSDKPTDNKGRFIQKYNIDEVWPDILNQINNGASLAKALSKSGMDYSTAKIHLKDNPELRQQYDEAVESRGDYLAEEIIAIADQEIPDQIDPKLASAWVTQQRNRIEARKWTASRLRPRVWGERMEVNVSHAQISITNALERANKRLEVIDITPAQERLESPKIQSEPSQNILSQESIIKTK
jgi:hypothetical protein